MSTETVDEHAGEDLQPPPPIDRWEVVRFLAPPLAYIFDLYVSYALVPHAYHAHRKTLLHLTALFSLCITLTSTIVSVVAYRRTRPNEADTTQSRRHVLALGGIGLGVMFTLLVIGGEIPNLILDPQE